MSRRNKTHNGRDASGHFKVKRADVEELKTDPAGTDFVRDDVRLGGAIEDIGPSAGHRGVRIGELVEEDREIRASGKAAAKGTGRGRRG